MRFHFVNCLILFLTNTKKKDRLDKKVEICLLVLTNAVENIIKCFFRIRNIEINWRCFNVLIVEKIYCNLWFC